MASLVLGLDPGQMKRLVIAPALDVLGLNSPAALNLLTGTYLVESGGVFLAQNHGPALGPWQMEPATEGDCWTNYLAFQPPLAVRVRLLLLPGLSWPQLVGNLPYAAAMCRIKYLRAPGALPAATDAAGLCHYWKTHYNTPAGAGAVDAEHIALFQRAVNA